MGAYNILEELQIYCPVCGIRSTKSVQFKTASNNRGENEVQFAYNSYIVGDKIPWWSRSDPHYAGWREGADDQIGPDAVDEWIRLRCANCLSELRVVISFESLYIVGISDISAESLSK